MAAGEFFGASTMSYEKKMSNEEKAMLKKIGINPDELKPKPAQKSEAEIMKSLGF